MNGKPYLEFREDGTFQVLHITDLQEGVHPKKDTLRLLNALLDTAKPDLVILTGDQLKDIRRHFGFWERKVFKIHCIF